MFLTSVSSIIIL